MKKQEAFEEKKREKSFLNSTFFVYFCSLSLFFFSCSLQQKQGSERKGALIFQGELPSLPDWQFLGTQLGIPPELMPEMTKLFIAVMRNGLQSRAYKRLCHRELRESPSLLQQEIIDFDASKGSSEPIFVSSVSGTRTLASYFKKNSIVEDEHLSTASLNKFLGFAPPFFHTCFTLKSYLTGTNYSYHSNKRERRKRRMLRRPFRVRSNIAWVQKSSFYRVLLGLRVRSLGEFKRLSYRALKTKSCPRNLSAALSLIAFNYFPQKGMEDLAEKLFDHTEPCLDREHSSWTLIHLRHGLYSIYREDYERASRLLLASMYSNRSKEAYRSLYWLGWIAHREGVSPEENSSWQLLLKNYPLSYYSILVHKSWEKDILDSIPLAYSHELSKKSETRPEWNTRLRWLEALLRLGERKQAIRWMEWMATDVRNLEISVINYLSSILLTNEIYRQNIVLLMQYYRYHPDKMSFYALRALYPRPFFQEVYEQTHEKIHTNLVMSLIRQESAFDPMAVSSARAKGLMQIISHTAKRMQRKGHKKLFDPKSNTKMGVKYLEILASRFEDKIELALAAYNAGPRRVKKWLKRIPHHDNLLLWIDLIPYLETRDYVVSILRNNYWYERLYGPLNIDHRKVLNSRLVQELLEEVDVLMEMQEN